MDLSVVVPTRNRHRSLWRLLVALEHQITDGVAFEVVVVDNGSVDRTAELLERYRGPLRLSARSEPTRGRAAACNIGIRAATGRIVALVDDDMEPWRTWLREHMRWHTTRCVAIVGASPSFGSAATAAGRYLQARFDRHLAKLEQAGIRSYRDVYTGNFSIERELLVSVGGFDDSFSRYGNEDGELALRLMAIGVRFLYDPAAIAVQHHEKDLGQAFADWYGAGATAIQLAALHPGAAAELPIARAGSRRRHLAWSTALTAARAWPRLPSALVAVLERVALPGRVANRIVALTLDLGYQLGAQEALRVAGSPLATRGARRDTAAATPLAWTGVAQAAAQDDYSELPPSSLIVSTRDRPAFLSALVASVLDGDHLPSELVIVDQSASPHPYLSTSAVTEHCEIRYVWSKTRGLSRGRNVGIATARQEVLAFVDDDALVERDWYRTLIKALVSAGPRTVVTGHVRAGEPESSGGFAASISPPDPANVYRGRVGQDVLMPLNMAMRRAVFDDVGPFDARLGAGSHFPSSEDNDFGYRLLEAGYEIVVEPRAKVVHRAWRPGRARIPMRWAYGRGQGAYFAKHAKRTDRYMTWRFMREVVRHVRQARRKALRDPATAAGDLVYAIAVLLGAIEWAVVVGRHDNHLSP